MSKKPVGKIKIIPLKPKEAIKKLEKNGFKCINKDGGDWYYFKEKDGKQFLVDVSVHPRELGKPMIKNIIRSAGKTNEEWVKL
jgi:predicted RNA binding protein YcfA (HicA-like mRNA interferase family)